MHRSGIAVRARLGRAALAGALALPLLAACSTTSSTSSGSDQAVGPGLGGTVSATTEQPVDGGALTFATLAETTGYDPTIDRWGVATSIVGSAILEPLAALDSRAQAQPWLLTDWKPNADFTSWTLTVRDGVTFHNGEKLDAEAVKKNLDAVVASPLTGIGLNGSITSSTVVDPKTVRVDLTVTWGSFPSSFLAGPNSFMRAPATLGPDGNAGKHPIGTGPFVFDKWEPDKALELVKNTSYWRPGEPHLDKLKVTPVVDDLTRVNALAAGDVDMMLTTSTKDAAELADKDTVIKDWSSETALLIANTRETAGKQPNPLHDEHARKAVALATDAQAIASLVGEDLEVPTSPFSKKNPWHDAATEQTARSHDLAKAKEEVEAYKKATGASALKVRLLGPTDTGTAAVLQAMQQQWAEAGIETTIESLEQNVYSLRGVQGDFELIYGPIYSSPDPDQNTIFWSKGTTKGDGEISINFSGYATDSTEAALVKGRQSADTDVRRSAYTALVNELNESGVNIWLYFTPYSLIASKHVHGLEQPSQVPFGNFQPKTWWGAVWVAP